MTEVDRTAFDGEVKMKAMRRDHSFGRWGAMAILAAVAWGCGGGAESREPEGDVREDASAAASPATPPATASPAPRPAPTPAPALIPAGTVLTFEVQEDVSTSSHRNGDVFTLALVSDVQGVNGAMVSAGSRAQGVVSESRASTGPEDEALLSVRVTSVEIGGVRRELVGRVESAEIQGSARDSGARTGATIATGAAAGAVIGRILGGDTRSTAQGAAVGAVAGTVVALTTRGGHATLPRGSRLVVRLDRELTL